MKQAIQLIKKGGIVVYPTESFYALGADATNATVIQTLFRAKHRKKKPIALIAADLKQVRRHFILSSAELELAKKHWPGSLTILLRPRKTISARALGARKIGVRVPAHAGARRLAKLVGVPITATSANRTGHPPTKSINKVKKAFPDILVVAGQCGRQRKPSTLIQLDQNHITILRRGAINASPLLP